MHAMAADIGHSTELPQCTRKIKPLGFARPIQLETMNGT